MEAPQKIQKIALVGNPNSGKTSVFNLLTGLNQKVGNYPGITVDKKMGTMNLNGSRITVLDLPGIYSIYPKTSDEQVVFDVLKDPSNDHFPDVAIVTVDSSNLERNLLLFTQIHDLQIPTILVLNMSDIASEEGIDIDHHKLSELLGHVPVVKFDARKGRGVRELQDLIANYRTPEEFIPIHENGTKTGENGQGIHVPDRGLQAEEADARYKKIRQILSFCISRKEKKRKRSRLTRRLDWWFTNPVTGYAIFIGLLFFIFQAIYVWAEIPMNFIDEVFLNFSQNVKAGLPAGVFTDLIAEGIIPGLGGVVIFIPQIALLFAFIAILEETGYMARVVFIMDRLMRPFGLNGRSVVPLISGMACAIPAIMATRTIGHWKDRLITIMVTPLMSCSARLPVYTLLIALVIPNQTLWGFVNLKGAVLMGMYLLGVVAVLISALFFKIFVKHSRRSYLVMELPLYSVPRIRNLTITLWEKVKIFIWEAGRIIMAISIILWVLASYGPSERMTRAVESVSVPEVQTEEAMREYQNTVATVRLENSWIGIVGQGIEPVIKPLGYNWQIGIALITSFAAREVFVGSMATIYSVGEDFTSDVSLLERMRNERDPDTGTKVYNLAAGLSLMVFYAFAMQCMSTLAIVFRETKTWKWPLIQLAYMSALAYIASLVVYQILK